jgi:Protein of unknown function (DUF3489)
MGHREQRGKEKTMNSVSTDKQSTSAAEAIVAETGSAKQETAKPKAARKNAKPSKKGKQAKPAKPTKRTAAAKKPGKASERSNKKADVIAMMTRAKGATLAEIMQATGWQKHTVRGFVSILGSKGGHTIESSKNPAGERTYKIAK